MLARFLGSAAAANLLVAALCGILLYNDSSEDSLIYLIGGIALAWWGVFYLGCYLVRLATTAKPRNKGQFLGGGFFLVLCLVFFIFATQGNSNTPSVLLKFSMVSLFIATVGYVIGEMIRHGYSNRLKRGVADGQPTTIQAPPRNENAR